MRRLLLAMLFGLSACSVFPPASVRQGGFWANPPDTAAIFRNVSQSVVTIKVHRRNELAGADQLSTLQSLRDLCGQNFDDCLEALEEVGFASGIGTGFFIDTQGLTLTAAHVVADAERIYLRMANAQSVVAQVVGRDSRNDLAILRPLTPLVTRPVRIGDSHRLEIGDPVVSIGSPFGLAGTLTVGLISAKDRRLSDQDEIPFLQSNVLVNPGNSGGPLFDRNGYAVGMTSRTFSASGGFSGVSFSIPIELAMLIVDDLRAGRPSTRGQVGALFAEVPPEMVELLSLPDASGALVTAIDRGGPFDSIGVRPGDIVRAVNDVALQHPGELGRLLFELKYRRSIKLALWRKGELIERVFSQNGVVKGTQSKNE